MLFLYSSFNIAALCISANNNTVMLNLTVKKNKNLHIPKKPVPTTFYHSFYFNIIHIEIHSAF